MVSVCHVSLYLLSLHAVDGSVLAPVRVEGSRVHINGIGPPSLQSHSDRPGPALTHSTRSGCSQEMVISNLLGAPPPSV